MSHSQDFNDVMPKSLVCGICRGLIANPSTCVQLSFHTIACQDCSERFSKEDLDLMVNIFAAFKGYFGMLNRDDFSLENLVFKLTNDIDDNDNLQVMNLKLLHESLLHGLTPADFLEKLGVISKKTGLLKNN